MPLTRRIQVFISEEASGALNKIVSRGLTQTEAVERGLLLLASLPVTRELSDTEQRLLDADVNPASAYELGRADGIKFASQPASSLDTKPQFTASDQTLTEHSILNDGPVGKMIKREVFTCPHPAKARRGKKCLDCGETV